MKRNAYGVWEITLPDKNGQAVITHNSKIKVREQILVLNQRPTDSTSSDLHGGKWFRSSRAYTSLD